MGGGVTCSSGNAALKAWAHVTTPESVYWQKPTFSAAGTDWSWSPWSALSWYCCSLRCCWKVLRDLSLTWAGGNTANRGSRARSSRRASSTTLSFAFLICLDWGADRRRASTPWCRSTWWTYTACTQQTGTTAPSDPRAWGNTQKEPPARPTQLEAFTTKVCINDIPLPVSPWSSSSPPDNLNLYLNMTQCLKTELQSLLFYAWLVIYRWHASMFSAIARVKKKKKKNRVTDEQTNAPCTIISALMDAPFSQTSSCMAQLSQEHQPQREEVVSPRSFVS